jgi:peroxiredoxin Q/BCP
MSASESITELREGDPAPEFSTTTDEGTHMSLRDFRGKPVVLYFYPKDDTPGCTIEACEFRDTHPSFVSRRAVILGVSPDTAASHQKFKHKFDLPFTLLVDDDHAIAERYGVWKEKSMFMKKYMGIERTTFIIDSQGRIARIFRRVKPQGHAAEVEQAIAAI